MTRKRLLPILPAAVFALTLLFRRAAAEGVKAGMNVVARSALPALFPFLVLSRALVLSLPEIRGPGRDAAVLAAGLFCGFPVGAKITADLWETGSVTRFEADRLLFSSNGAGAAFLAGICGAGLFGDARYGWALWGAQAVFSVAGYFLYPLFVRNKSAKRRAGKTAVTDGASVWTRAAADAAPAFLTLAAFILFFSFLREVLVSALSLDSALPRAVLGLFLEIGGGTASLAALPRAVSLPLAAAGAGWGGLSVHLQTRAVLKDAGLSAKPFLCGKLLLCPLMLFSGIILQNLLP